MRNSIVVIQPYKGNGMLVFDDERGGLDKEPFVAGADTMIDAAVKLKGIPNADGGVLMVFSAGPFPDANFHLEWVREEGGGNVYKGRFEVEGEVQEMEGGVCRALNLYYPDAPKKLYVQFGRRSRSHLPLRRPTTLAEMFDARKTMMIREERSELAIPRMSSGELVFIIVIFTIAVVATAVAVLELFFGVAIIVPSIWLATMASCAWGACQDQSGVRKCLINLLGFFACKQFVESVPQDAGSVEIRFGYQLFGRRLFYFRLPLGKVETVEWLAGQNPEFWSVIIWFDHDDPQKSRTSQWCRKPDQKIYCVGPSRCKEKTEVLGLAVVDFLCRAGATLVRGKDDCTFMRATPRTTNNVKRPPM